MKRGANLFVSSRFLVALIATLFFAGCSTTDNGRTSGSRPTEVSSCESDFGVEQVAKISRLAAEFQEAEPPNVAGKMVQFLGKQEAQVSEIRREVLAWGKCLVKAPAKLREFQRAYIRWADAESALLAVTKECYKLSYPSDIDCVEAATFGDVGFRLYQAMDDLSLLHQEAMAVIGQ